jgi:hypothetical protein
MLSSNIAVGGGGGGQKLKYTGMDLYRHCQSTVIKDFNNGSKIEQRADIIFCLGFFSYIYDVKPIIKDIYINCEMMVASYRCLEDLPNRGNLANGYSKEEFKKLFTDEGFIFKGSYPQPNTRFETDTIFIFSKYQDDRFLKNPITALAKK